MDKFKGKQIYKEAKEKSIPYKEMYLNSINDFIQKGFVEAEKQRMYYMSPEKLKENEEEFRKEYLSVIGYPKIEPLNPIPDVKKEFIDEDEMCSIYRLSIEVFSGFWFYGLLMIPHEINEKAPLVIAQHGGGGTPEFCCDMYGANNYSNFTKYILDEKMIVFAPQLLLWKFKIDTGETFPEFDIPFERQEIDGKLKQLGISITGLEVFCLRRSLDYLEKLSIVDKDRIGMMGLSYGGFFSLYTAAADLRIKVIYTAGAFNDRSKEDVIDWFWKNSAYKFHDAEVAGLCCPRKLFIDVGKEDPVFDYQNSLKEAERVRKYYKFFGKEENFVYNLWNGGHKFDVNGKGFRDFFQSLRNL